MITIFWGCSDWGIGGWGWDVANVSSLGVDNNTP